MGQRLNIEIWNNGEVLANSYYHRGGYMEDEIHYVTKILEEYKPTDATLNDAIRLFEVTGARLLSYEAAKKDGIIYTKIPDSEINRNDGLIAINDDAIEETRRWEDERVTIYLDRKVVIFDVRWHDWPEEVPFVKEWHYLRQE